MVGPFGSSKCGLTPTSLRSLLSFILPLSHGLMEKSGCTLGTLKKFPPFLLALSSSVTHRGGGHLRSLCLLRQRCMVLRISTNSRAKASLESLAWGAYLQSRDLVVIRSSNARVEAYCPSLMVRQFGLVQLLPVPPIWTKNTDWTSQALITKDEAKQISVLARERVTGFTFTPFQVQSVSSSIFHSWWETYMTHFNNEDDLIEALQGCCPTFLLYQLVGIFLTFPLLCMCCLYCLKHNINFICFIQVLISSTWRAM